MKWEYMALSLKGLMGKYSIYNPTIDKIGAEGWELVSVDNEIAYFKRPLEEIPPAIVVIYTDKSQKEQEIADAIGRHLHGINMDRVWEEKNKSERWEMNKGD